MKITISSDHGGYELALKIVEHLKTNQNIEIIDFVPESDNPVDYPDKAMIVASSVANQLATFGILVCGTGIGMSIAANKTRGIRAALVTSEYTARMSREHNDANILCLGGRTTKVEDAFKFVDIFLETKFEGGRHIRRIAKITTSE